MKPSMTEIARATAEYFNLTVEELRGPGRKAKVAWPRQIAMTLSRELSDRSTPEIGQFFGGRDHTTVLHAKQTVDNESVNCKDCVSAMMSIAVKASAMSSARQALDRDRADGLHLGILYSVPPVPPPPPPPVLARIPIRARPVTLPSDLRQPTLKRLMGARA